MPRRVSWGADDYFISEDHAALDALAQFRRDRGLSFWVSRLEANFSGVALVMFTLATLVLFGLYGIPRITASIAHQLPLTVSAQMAQSTMTNLTPLLQESELTESRQQQLRSYFLSMSALMRLLLMCTFGEHVRLLGRMHSPSVAPR